MLRLLALALSFAIAGCQTKSPYTYSNYDYSADNSQLTMPNDKSHPFYKNYHDSITEYRQKFIPHNEIDRVISLKGEALKSSTWQKNNIAHSLAMRYVEGFPGFESESVIRVETRNGWCKNYDCTVDAVQRKSSRSEKIYKPSKLGSSDTFLFSFYIPIEGNLLDGTENLHITQLKGGAEEVPSWIGIAPVQRTPDESTKRNLKIYRKTDENGFEITEHLVESGNKPWIFNPWGSGIIQVDDDIKTGDLVVFFRSIFGIQDHVGRYMLKLSDAEKIKGKWHKVKIDVKWSREPKAGYLKYTFNDEVIIDCNPCQTAPNHQFSNEAKDSGLFNFHLGAYRWINSNIIKMGGYLDHTPRDVVIYYKDVAIN